MMLTNTSPISQLDPRLAYLADGIVSLIMGVTLFALAGQLTDLAGWPLPPEFLAGLGLLLLPWGIFNLVLSRVAYPAQAMIHANIMVDAAWVIGSLVLLAAFAGSMTALGIALVTGQALAVAGVFAIKMMGRGSFAR